MTTAEVHSNKSSGGAAAAVGAMDDHPRKSGILTDAEKEIYARIERAVPEQKEEFRKFLANVLGVKGQEEQKAKAAKWGFDLCVESGRIKYSSTFKPLNLPYDVVYVRHGKTEGNTEPRIYQGDVDYWQNELVALGKEQAEAAADRIEQMMREANWQPDLVVLSPLDRAVKTAEPFLKRHPEVKSVKDPGFKEMAFGCYDNVRVIDVPANSIAHLFYLEQNALFRAEEGHKCGPGFKGRAPGDVVPAESFVDVIDRMGNAMCKLTEVHRDLLPAAAAADRRLQILFFGHSMAGAAASMLLGHGKCDDTGNLCFDGKYIMPNATPTKLPPKQP